MSEIFEKSNVMLKNFTQRLDKLDDLFQKSDRRILMLERDITVQKQDLASHKLQKERQIDNLEEKAWEIQDFKNEL
jgi:hypothetical protein